MKLEIQPAGMERKIACELRRGVARGPVCHHPAMRGQKISPPPVHPGTSRTRSSRPSTGCAGFTSRWVSTRCENPVIVEESDIYRQFGPEAMAVLDRVFYIGGLPRPNVGIAKKQLDEINEILKSHKSPLVHGHPVPAGEGGHKEVPADDKGDRGEAPRDPPRVQEIGDRWGRAHPSNWQKSSGWMTGLSCISSMRSSPSSSRSCPSPRGAPSGAT